MVDSRICEVAEILAAFNYIQRYSMQVESGLQSALHLYTVRLFVNSDDTRGCGDTICPREDEQGAARNMLRIVV